jgi:UDP-N-acetylmuramate dehydrogenase
MASWNGFEHIVRQGEPLAMHTWFQLGGPAEFFAEPEDPDQLIGLLARCHDQGVEVRILGQGSNILVCDEGVPGMVLRLTSPEFGKIAFDGPRVTVGGGANLGRLVTSGVHRGLAGLEMLVGIPGTVGGALHGNTGSHGGDIGQWTMSATVLTVAGETIERGRDDLFFGYRESNLDEPVILEATLVLDEDDPRELARRMQKHWIIKRANQPMGHQCAGCIFKNPRGASAGELIEKSGLKGTRIGGAVVSERHANFIIAEPDCTSQDVVRLIELIRAQVNERMGVRLELEIEIW